MRNIPYNNLKYRKSRSREYTTPSYSGGPSCKSVAENRLPWPRDLESFLISYIHLILNASQHSGYHRGLQADFLLWHYRTLHFVHRDHSRYLYGAHNKY